MSSDTQNSQFEVGNLVPPPAAPVRLVTLEQKILALRLAPNLRIAALGDSAVFGVGDTSKDRNSDGPGWVGRLAHDLEANSYINLSKNGSRATTVMDEQLIAATFFLPNLVCICVGMNDVMRGNFSKAQIREALVNLIQTFNEFNALVVLLGLPDPSGIVVAPRSVKRVLSRRVAILNQISMEVAQSENGIFISGWDNPDVYQRNFWHIDRMHPSAEGHQKIADLIRTTLNLPLRAKSHLPALSLRTKAMDLKWLALNGSKWFLKRSIDLIPTLIYLLIVEYREKNLKTAT